MSEYEGHTTGDWWAEGCYIAAHVPGGRPNGEIIGRMETWSNHGVDHGANARLAAAAPALLADNEKLRDAMVMLGSYLGVGPGSLEFTNSEDMVERIRDGVEWHIHVQTKDRVQEKTHAIRAERDWAKNEVAKLRAQRDARADICEALADALEQTFVRCMRGAAPSKSALRALVSYREATK